MSHAVGLGIQKPFPEECVVHSLVLPLDALFVPGEMACFVDKHMQTLRFQMHQIGVSNEHAMLCFLCEQRDSQTNLASPKIVHFPTNNISFQMRRLRTMGRIEKAQTTRRNENKGTPMPTSVEAQVSSTTISKAL